MSNTPFKDRTVLNKAIGNVRKNYSPEDFNPFRAMEYIYDYCLHTGTGNTILIVGHTPRFEKEIVRAWQHVLSDRNMISPDKLPPLPVHGEYDTHTGATLKFVNFPDVSESDQKLFALMQRATVIVLCSPYKSPEIRNVIRACTSTKLIYDVSQNNVKKDVDSEG